MVKSKIDKSVASKTSLALEEDRFTAAETRPQFKVPKASASKVVLDDRFSSVLTDSRFQVQGKDKYGRKKKKKNIRNAAEKELESFYVVENSNNNRNEKISDRKFSDTEDEKKSIKSKPKADTSDDEEVTNHGSRISYLTALSRGEIGVSSSSESDDSSDSSDDDDDSHDNNSVYGTRGVLDPSTKQNEEIEISYDSSPYLVVTNMDWENIRAVDLFCILSSFAPPGAVRKVQVFQSDFGMKQMAKDKLHGPTGIWQEKETRKKNDSAEGDHSDDNESDEENPELSIDVINESDFDPEKLRDYEASKLKYFFAVTELLRPEYADIIYQEVDGMEFEHSSTAVDLRTLPKESLESVIADRPMRDQATSIPGKYEPPEFIVSALQQTNVQCTWDQGDKEREKKLTSYGNSNWQESFEMDDLKAYLASDGSTDEDSEDENDKRGDKRSMMRKALGLNSDSESGSGSDSENVSDGESSSSSSSILEIDSKDGKKEQSHEREAMSKQLKIIPGRKDLEERIRSKLGSKETTKELTPWEKYHEKRKQKRKERRQVTRENTRSRSSKNNSIKKDIRPNDKDDFFASDDDTGAEFEPMSQKNDPEKDPTKNRNVRVKPVLLLDEEQVEEEARDYDIRGIQRIERNKGKKLKGSRKRKEAKITAEVSGSGFKINVHDDRFKAVLDGDDGRFGIDKTDPNFKDTTSMREILSEQTKRRKNKRQKKSPDRENVDNCKIGGGGNNEREKSGATALSFLVQKLKSQVHQTKS